MDSNCPSDLRLLHRDWSAILGHRQLQVIVEGTNMAGQVIFLDGEYELIIGSNSVPKPCPPNPSIGIELKVSVLLDGSRSVPSRPQIVSCIPPGSQLTSVDENP